MSRNKKPARPQEWDYSHETGLRATARWQAAHREYLAAAADVHDGHDGDARYQRMIAAAYDLYHLDATHRGRTPKPMQDLLRDAGKDPARFIT